MWKVEVTDDRNQPFVRKNWTAKSSCIFHDWKLSSMWDSNLESVKDHLFWVVTNWPTAVFGKVIPNLENFFQFETSAWQVCCVIRFEILDSDVQYISVNGNSIIEQWRFVLFKRKIYSFTITISDHRERRPRKPGDVTDQQNVTWVLQPSWHRMALQFDQFETTC
jgi:hypothetical protein